MELIDLDTKNRCIKPFPIEYGRGGLINDDTILSCNSYDTFNCYSMSLNDLQPKLLNFTLKPRNYPASVVLDTGRFWLTGGSQPTNFSIRTDDTEIISQTDVKPGPTLPEPIDGHCMVRINSTTIALLSGKVSGSNTDKTWFIHTNTEPWMKVAGPTVNTARYIPGCAKFEFKGDTFLALMGSGQPQHAKKVEFLKIKDTNWITGKN